MYLSEETTQEHSQIKCVGNTPNFALKVLDYLMNCDLGNICARAERKTNEKPVNKN
jgi:hypothetical protein